MAFSASSYPPIAPTEVSKIGNELNDIACEHRAHKWIIDQDQALVLKHYNYLTEYHSFTVKGMPSSSRLGNSRGIISLRSSPKRLPNFDPSRTFGLTDEFGIQQAQKLKEVRQVLLSKLVGEEDPIEGLVIIDTIQRLGIDYHFQEEIEKILQRQYVLMSRGGDGDSDHDLYEVSLRFRLLRQEGYYVPADVFNNFKDKEGNFKQSLSEDIRGLMGLYEASQLSVQGEDILVEIGDFSSQLLNECMAHLNHHEARVVANALKYPNHKSLSRFVAKNFLSNFQGTNDWINVLKELTKMDFNMVQSIHKKEILQISKWWNDLGLVKELKLARDQPIKWYMWPMAILTDPRLSQQRVELTKPISLVYIIDDIFDLYGTVDELNLFTEAVSRWELAAVDQLPDYMKTCFKALYDITNEIGYNFFKEHGWNPVDILRKTWMTLCNAFLVEAKWFASEHMPNAEEYLKNGVVSSGVHVVLVHLFFLLGEGVTNETVGLMNEAIPGIIYNTAMILRLWDDLGSAKDENQDGKDGSYVECYMKEHQGCSAESAREHIVHMISDTWKCLNKECLSPNNPFSSSFTKASLNAARMVPLMYSYDDNQCLPSLEQHMKSLLYERFD